MHQCLAIESIDDRRCNHASSSAEAGWTRDRCDALEEALAACLATFADLAAASGQSEHAARVRSAVDQLQREPSTVRLLRPDDQLNTRLRGSVATRTSLRKPRSLTAREQEVAELIAGGRTNRQIAEALVISERTADTHVQNILNRLGLVSRAQVAAWVAQRAPHRPD